jgi:CBS domain-containing protein
MGSAEIKKINAANKKKFLKALLNDIDALDIMLKENKIESGIKRIGAEQEFALVDRHYRPSKNGPEILGRIGDPHFTTELAKYNLEINLDPIELKDKAFAQMEKQLRLLLNKADDLAQKTDDHIILTGILPSIDIRAVKMDFMTPNPRYFALDEIIKELRGEDFELNILGVDELILAHTNILFEACNTSFQMHLQVDPEEFADMYNWAQMISGPVLAISANSPLLFGRQLWSETRISLFQQSIDMRSKGYHLREREQRVSFGNGWIECITDIYKNDITRFPLILAANNEENSLERLKKGEIPKLASLNLHNGTIWKWNRPCYGVANGVAHLRIENRYIPSGPTVIDEMANMAFWVGLMQSMPEKYRGNWKNQEFDQAKENFYKAATAGMQSAMVWEGEILSSRDLVRKHLLGMAEEGLKKVGIASEDIERYLGVIEGRVSTGQNGSRWTINSFRKLKKEMDRDDALIALTADMHRQRKSRKPVHQWRLPALTKAKNMEVDYNYVVNVMRTDIITVQENDLIDLVAKIMEWRNIRHIPVENQKGKILGVLTRKHIDAYFQNPKRKKLATAGEVMQRQVITIEPETDVKFALLLMIEHKVSCLPVVSGDQLVGIITDTDAHEVWEKLKKRNAAN